MRLMSLTLNNLFQFLIGTLKTHVGLNTPVPFQVSFNSS